MIISDYTAKKTGIPAGTAISGGEYAAIKGEQASEREEAYQSAKAGKWGCHARVVTKTVNLGGYTITRGRVLYWHDAPGINKGTSVIVRTGKGRGTSFATVNKEFFFGATESLPR